MPLMSKFDLFWPSSLVGPKLTQKLELAVHINNAPNAMEWIMVTNLQSMMNNVMLLQQGMSSKTMKSEPGLNVTTQLQMATVVEPNARNVLNYCSE